MAVDAGQIEPMGRILSFENQRWTRVIVTSGADGFSSELANSIFWISAIKINRYFKNICSWNTMKHFGLHLDPLVYDKIVDRNQNGNGTPIDFKQKQQSWTDLPGWKLKSWEQTGIKKMILNVEEMKLSTKSWSKIW